MGIAVSPVPTDTSAFVDWRSVTYGALRPILRPKEWRFDPSCLAEILSGLRRELGCAAAGPAAIIDTYLYGGFTTESGESSVEHVALTEAITRADWVGRPGADLPRFREISTVYSVSLDLPQTTLKALYRERETAPSVRLRARGTVCTCDWTLLALKLFGERRETDSKLACPVCRETRLEFESPKQKLVDTLLATHIVRRAAELQSASGPSEIIVISDDADALPAICASAAMGVRTKWIQTRLLKRYGYRDVAIGLGVEVLEVHGG